VFSDRIRSARARKRLTLREVALRVGLSHTAVQKYERGDLKPNSDVALRFSKALEVPLSFLLRPSRVPAIEPAFRKRAKTSKAHQEHWLAEVREALERYVEIALITEIDVQPFEWPAGFPYPVANEAQAEAAADALREAWDVGHDPMGPLIPLLEMLGVWVLDVAGPKTIDAASFTLDNYGQRPVIALPQTASSGERQRFTVAHELGHLALSIPPLPNEPEDTYTLRVERLCNRFAGALLMPKASMIRYWGDVRTRLSGHEFRRFKATFGVSYWTVVCRLKDHEVIGRSEAGRWFKTFSGMWGRKQEPDPLPLEKPERFALQVHRATAEGLISDVRARELLLDPQAQFGIQFSTPQVGDGVALYHRIIKVRDGQPAQMHVNEAE